jgi:hypothetical protein
MDPLKFIQSLLPNFTKISVTEDCRMTKLEILNTTQPSYENALRIFGNRKFLNADLREDFAIYQRLVKPGSSANTVAAVEKSFKSMLSTLDLVEKLVEDSYNDEIAGGGVTYYKASVLQMLESIAFASRYARKYLNYVLVVETAMADDDKGATLASELNAAIVPADLRWIKQNFVNFCSVMATLNKPTAAIKSEFEKIPDVVVSEQNAKVFPTTLGNHRLDPFNHGAVSSPFNVIYHVRMAFAEWQVNRLNAAKEEKSLLELRKLRMERQIAGKKDAALEKQIDYIQGRIEDLEAHIKQKEQEYA